jgi:hypothetical protein
MVLSKKGKLSSKKGSKSKPGKKKSSFVYKERDPASVKARAEQTGGRFDSTVKPNVEMFKFEQGDNSFRILPPTWDDHEHYGYDVWVHRNVGADNSAYLCLNKMKGKSCPICALYKELKDDGQDEDAKSIAPTRRVYMWVIDRDAEDDAPKLMDMSWTMDRDVSALCQNKKTGKTLLIDHPDEGYDVTVKRQGTGLKTRYFGISIDREPSPISDDPDVQEGVLEYVQENPIPSVLNFYDAKYLDRILSGTSEEADEDLDEDEEDEDDKKKSKATKRKKPAKGGKRKPAEDDEDEEEEEEESDDDESDEDDESEDEDSDEDEDDDSDEDEEDEEESEDEDEDEDESDDEDEEDEEDESEDEDEDESDDEDEEDEEDESENEEEEEDEEEEAPRRGGGSRKKPSKPAAKSKSKAPARRPGVTRRRGKK